MKEEKIQFKAREIEQIASFEIGQIDKVYIGTPNRCMCGCSGEYFEDALKIKRFLNKFIKHDSIAESIDNYIFTKIIGTRQYTIYLKN